MISSIQPRPIKQLLIPFLAFLTIPLLNCINPKTEPPTAPDLIALRGEILGFPITYSGNNGCAASSSAQTSQTSQSGITLKHYKISETITKLPSYVGAQIGPWPDSIEPVSQLCDSIPYWLEITTPQSAKPETLTIQSLNRSWNLKILETSLPAEPSMPLYIQMQPWDISRAHGDLNQQNFTLYPPYFDRMIANRIYPLKHWIDASSTHLTASFQYATQYAWLPLSIYNTFTDSQAREQISLAKSRNLKPLVYLVDEPSGSELAQAITLAKRIHAIDPLVELIATTKWSQSLQDAGIKPCEVLHPGHISGKAKCYYTSCMANGCGPATGGLSGAPDLVLDHPPIFSRIYPWIAHFLGSDYFIYYNMLEGHKDQRSSPMISHPVTKSQWGNLDGVLIHPDIQNSKPIETLRMKYLLRGMQDIEILKLANQTDLSALIRSPFDWERSSAPFDSLIQKAKESLKWTQTNSET